MANQRVIYTGGKGPASLFLKLSWDLMWHASSAHLWWSLGCPSITVELLQLSSCPSSTTCYRAVGGNLEVVRPLGEGYKMLRAKRAKNFF